MMRGKGKMIHQYFCNEEGQDCNILSEYGTISQVADQKLIVANGDAVEFVWEGLHNVYLLKDFNAFTSCDWAESSLIPGGASSGVKYAFAGEGRILYFGCKIGSHCQMGQKLAVTIDSTAAADATADPVLDPTTFDFSSHVKRQHPGTGNEFKTLVYIELKGAWDGASGFVNVRDENEIHLWCSKRPTLSAVDYCDCVSTEAGICTKYELKTGSEKKVFELQNTDGHLAMTDLFASGTTGWLQLWDDRDMAVVPGVGRYDHARSHFEVKDAAAKGVSVEEEKHTSNGWLGKSIFGEKTGQSSVRILLKYRAFKQW